MARRRAAEPKPKRIVPTVPSLCWSCRNAVPSLQKGTGCNWSREFKPVEGWEAQRRDLCGYMECQWKDGAIESYRVVRCPEYRQDSPAGQGPVP